MVGRLIFLCVSESILLDGYNLISDLNNGSRARYDYDIVTLNVHPKKHAYCTPLHEVDWSSQ